MNSKGYRILRGMKNFYVAKILKDGRTMSASRYEISRSEIFQMFFTLIEEDMDATRNDIQTITVGGVPTFEVKRIISNAD